MSVGRRADPAQDRGHRAAGRRRCSPAAGRCCGSSRAQMLRRRRDDRCAARHDAARPVARRRSRTRRRSWRRRISRKGLDARARACGGACASSSTSTSLAAIGDGARRSACAYAVRRHGARRSPSITLLLHQGVVPDVNLAGAAGCALAWNDAARVLRAGRRRVGRHDVASLFVAGDGAGIAGARSGGGARHAHRARGGQRARPHRRARRATARRRRCGARWRDALRGRRFLDALYRPADAFRVPTGDTLACRCEEVTARRDRRRGARAGAPAPTRRRPRCAAAWDRARGAIAG